MQLNIQCYTVNPHVKWSPKSTCVDRNNERNQLNTLHLLLNNHKMTKKGTYFTLKAVIRVWFPQRNLDR
jgi:hypothetical protein